MRKILSFILTLVACLGLGGLVYSNTVNAAAGDTYHLVKDANELVEGDVIQIVNIASKTALGEQQNGNNRAKQELGDKLVNDTLPYVAGAQDIVLERGTKPNTFAFKVTSSSATGYLLAGSSKKNYLHTNPTLDDNASWLITIKDGITEIKAQGNNTRNNLKYNTVSKIFSCYSSGQGNVDIFKKDVQGLVTTFDLNYEGSVPVKMSTPSGQKVRFPQNPTREGYKFIGWFTEAAAGTQVAEDNFLAQEVTLYAHWEALPKAVVTLHLNNGQSNVTLNDGYVGALLKEPKETPLKDGYEFVGWYKDVELTTPWNFETDVIVSEALDLYAKYVEIQTITCAEANKLLNTNAKKVVIIARYVKDANSKFTMSDTTGTVEIYHKSSQQVQEEVEKINTVGATYLIHAETNSSYKNLTNVTKVQLIANPLENVQTKASLRVSYENNQATTVDLRIGGIIPAECYNEAYEYGVLVLANNEAFDITKFNEYKQAGKAVAFTKEEIAAVEGGHQLGLVLTGIPQASYNFGVNGYIYVVKDSMVYLAKAKENASVVSVAGETITVLEAEVATKPELQQIIDILKTIK